MNNAKLNQWITCNACSNNLLLLSSSLFGLVWRHVFPEWAIYFHQKMVIQWHPV